MSGRTVGTVEHAIPFHRTSLHFVKAVLCLGIPYMFESQDRDRRMSNRITDEEEQVGRTPQKPDDILLGSGHPLVVSVILLILLSIAELPLVHLGGTTAQCLGHNVGFTRAQRNIACGRTDICSVCGIKHGILCYRTTWKEHPIAHSRDALRSTCQLICFLFLFRWPTHRRYLSMAQSSPPCLSLCLHTLYVHS